MIDRLTKSLVRKCLFHPEKMNDEMTDAYLKMPNIGYITTEGGSKIYYSIQMADNVTDKYLIYSHGNKSNIYRYEKYCAQLAKECNINVVSYDYPTYGLSTGTINENSCYEAISAIIDMIKNVTSISNIYLIGRSLGTGVVVDYISKNEWQTPSILISPYRDIVSIAMSYVKIPVLRNIVDTLFDQFHFDSKTKMINIHTPVRIIHGKKDTLIPVSHATELFDLLPNKNLEPILFDDANHEDIFEHITMEMIIDVITIKN